MRLNRLSEPFILSEPLFQRFWFDKGGAWYLPSDEMPTETAAVLAGLTLKELLTTVEAELAATPFIDVHTHLYMPSLGLGLWGIDELVTYHYLEAELFRSSPITPEQYWTLPKRERA